MCMLSIQEHNNSSQLVIIPGFVNTKNVPGMEVDTSMEGTASLGISAMETSDMETYSMEYIGGDR
jgi:hypothetical protein